LDRYLNFDWNSYSFDLDTCHSVHLDKELHYELRAIGEATDDLGLFDLSFSWNEVQFGGKFVGSTNGVVAFSLTLVLH